MATLTIKNFPDELYAALSINAKKHRRSINSEAIVCLEQSLQNSEPNEVEGALEMIRKTRSKLKERGIWLTDEILDFAKDEGRP